MVRTARSYRTAFITLMAVAFCLRLAAGYWWQQRLPGDSKFAFGDSHSYWVLAESISRGGAYEYGAGRSRAFRTPGYPLLLSGLFFLSAGDPPVIWARCLGAVLGTIAVGGVIWLAQQCFDLRTALAAGVFAALYPGAIGMSVFVLSEAPFCPLMLAQLGCWTAACSAHPPRRLVGWGIAAGLAAGLATLVRPSWLFFTPLAVSLLLANRSWRRNQLSFAAAMLFSFLLAMSPWWVRNWAIYGRFVPTTLQVGASLYDGLNEEATGASNMDFVQSFYDQQQRADAAGAGPLPGTFEERLDQRMRKAALDWARAHPWAAVQLMGTKLVRMWSPLPSAEEFDGWGFRLLIGLGYLPLLVLAVWGATLFLPKGWPIVLCLLPACYFTALHVIFVSSIRYRQPAMMPLIVLAAAGLVHGLTHFARPHRAAQPG